MVPYSLRLSGVFRRLAREPPSPQGRVGWGLPRSGRLTGGASVSLARSARTPHPSPPLRGRRAPWSEHEPRDGSDHRVQIVPSTAKPLPERVPRTVSSSSFTSTASTRQPRGPWRKAASTAATASGSPASTVSTVPSRRLRTEPSRQCSSAWPLVQALKPTPWTRPRTTARTVRRPVPGDDRLHVTRPGRAGRAAPADIDERPLRPVRRQDRLHELAVKAGRQALVAVERRHVPKRQIPEQAPDSAAPVAGDRGVAVRVDEEAVPDEAGGGGRGRPPGAG